MNCGRCAFWKAFDASGIWGDCDLNECEIDGSRLITNRDESCGQFVERSEEGAAA